MNAGSRAMIERNHATADTNPRLHATQRKPARHLRVLAAGLAGAVWLLLPAHEATAEAKHYALDPVHTRIVFSIDHLGFSKSLGTFSHPRGSLWFDPDDWSTARLDVTIDIASLDLGDADWNKRMLKRDYFDIRKHTEARFVSRAIEVTGEDTAHVLGDFTLRGDTRPLTLQVRLNRHGRHPLTFRTTAGFSATATLKRSDFGMTDNLRTVGDTVELRIEAEAERERDDGNKNDDNPPASEREPNSPTTVARGASREAPSHREPT